MDGFEPRVFFMPRTYAYGECVIWVGGAPTLGELEYDLAAMNTLRWETVVMAGICSQGTVGDHHTGGLLVAGQNQKIWIGMLKLPRQLQRPMRQNVALNDPDHRLILAGCEWGNPKNPTDPAQACPFWGMFEDGGDSGGQRFVSAGDSADQDQNSELEAGAGANAQDIETGLQYCLATNNGASTCGWAAACKPQPPPETLLSRVLWGIRSIYDSVGICAANSKAVSALSITD
ncbi:MAG: hypothetical protein M1812_001554 [Candelaria pacifica]|nr:MAG: hypothetical protein M1812_001554 [Candelaria pacifica]